MDVNGVKVLGSSVSGVGTCLVLPYYKVVLDIGYCFPEAVSCQTVLISHCHVDHMAGAVSHAAGRSLAGMTPSRFVCSPDVAEKLGSLLKLWTEIQGGFKYEIVPLSPGDAPLPLGKGFSVRAIPTNHRVPSQGYVISDVRFKLKPEYQGLPGKSIGALHAAGVEIQERCDIPVVAFLGDTTPEALEHSGLQETKLVITECTFVGFKKNVEHAREMGHTHLDELAPILTKMTGPKAFLLMHFSLRHSPSEIRDEVDRILDAKTRGRVHLFLKSDNVD